MNCSGRVRLDLNSGETLKLRHGQYYSLQHRLDFHSIARPRDKTLALNIDGSPIMVPSHHAHTRYLALYRRITVNHDPSRWGGSQVKVKDPQAVMKLPTLGVNGCEIV
ncbi:hypothetical protein HPP92_003861 [Vanilla planifolia]|uniref:Uncharacterized protein n=1 Tax=Vanilla planifolia TaxID=51239 RepID=A0A835S8U9_VANPL|nr:hypothetical protein HPP92_003861 [Vanilla planifolia]